MSLIFAMVCLRDKYLSLILSFDQFLTFITLGFRQSGQQIQCHLITFGALAIY